MKTKRLIIGFVILTLGLFITAGCATTPTKEAKWPDWISKGSGAFDDAEIGKVFYGLGIASGIENKSLARSVADDRARAEIAKTLEIYVAVLAKDYMASTTAGDMSASSEEQHVEQALKTFAKTTLHGAIIVDRWIDPNDGAFYSLCKLDLFSFNEALEKNKELNSKVRDYVRNNSEKLHKQLELMEQKE